MWCDIAACSKACGGSEGWLRARLRWTLLDKRNKLLAKSSVWSQLCVSYLILGPKGHITLCLKNYVDNSAIKLLQDLIYVTAPVVLFMFTREAPFCLLGATLICTSSLHSVGHFICPPSIAVTNHKWHSETVRPLTFPSPGPTLAFFVLNWCPVDGISWPARIIIHNTGVALWQHISRNRYPYFPYPPTIHSLSLHLPNLQQLLSSHSPHNQPHIRFQPLFHSLIALPSIFLCRPSPFALLSLYQGIILSAQVYRHRYPLCSSFLCSALLSPCPSTIPLVSVIFISYPSSPRGQLLSVSVI